MEAIESGGEHSELPSAAGGLGIADQAICTQLN